MRGKEFGLQWGGGKKYEGDEESNRMRKKEEERIKTELEERIKTAAETQ